MSCSKIAFPQPVVVALTKGTMYWFVTIKNEPDYFTWHNDSADKALLAVGNCYKTQEEAQHRSDWNKQELARLIIPAWFRALGPEVEFFSGLEWKYLDEQLMRVTDWSTLNQDSFRAAAPKTPDIVKVIDGVEYRWPATVTINEKPGLRYLVNICDFGIYEHSQSCITGSTVHLTRQGAEAQAAALKAFWK